MKEGLPGSPTLGQWLLSQCQTSDKIGFDARLLSQRQNSILQHELQPKELVLTPIKPNLIDQIRSDERPPLPLSTAFVHPIERSGVSSAEKIRAIREHLKTTGADLLVASALDEICWVLNVRGSDITNTPVIISYLIVTPNTAVWFVSDSQLSPEIHAHLKEGGVTTQPYEDFHSYLQNIEGQRALVNDLRCGASVYFALKQRGMDLVENDFITEQKSIKNNVELEGIKNCHKHDAVAVVSLLHWLENKLEKGEVVTEYDVAEKAEQLRSQQKDYVSLSFDTISGSGPNGAIIHYKPNKESAATVTKDKLFLLDSGGQYLGGTTDVTRTVHFGIPTEHEKLCNTLVLKGHINLATTIFPPGTTGIRLDSFARQALWKYGLDYRHGTGHGVGAFMNVHEGPHGLSYRETKKFPFKPGMTITIEPGYYEEGNFGIRIENLLIVKHVKTPFMFAGSPSLGFENITCIPIQTKLVDASLLEQSEIKWLNDHNQWCLDTLSPLIQSDDILQWLKNECLPI